MFKISASEIGTVSMRRRIPTCPDEFVAIVTEGLVRGVYKVVTRLSFGTIW